MIETADSAPSPELELVLKMLITDRAFRIAFFADPPAALSLAGIHLCPAERAALAESPLELLDAFAARIDWTAGPAAVDGVALRARRCPPAALSSRQAPRNTRETKEN